MTVESFRTFSFKGLRDQEVALDPKLTILVGENGAGKSSALEALQIGCRGRPLRSKPAECARDHGKLWRVDARIASDGNPVDRLSVAWDGRTTVSINEQRLTFNQYYRTQPVALIDWSSHELAYAGPSTRRGFLDWQLFHVEQSYAQTWFQWRRLLAQRNKALQLQQSESTIVAWDQSLAIFVEAVDQARRRAVADVVGKLRQLLQEFLSLELDEFGYASGWSGDYLASLRERLDQDRRRGRTSSGPQRGDWQLKAGDRSIGDMSRGEQKLVLAALLLSSVSAIREATGKMPLILVDDFAAELSDKSQDTFKRMLADSGGQVVLATHRYEAKRWPTSHQMFHVEHGVISVAVE